MPIHKNEAPRSWQGDRTDSTAAVEGPYRCCLVLGLVIQQPSQIQIPPSESKAHNLSKLMNMTLEKRVLGPSPDFRGAGGISVSENDVSHPPTTEFP